MVVYAIHAYTTLSSPGDNKSEYTYTIQLSMTARPRKHRALSTGRCPCVGLMLAHRVQRWIGIEPNTGTMYGVCRGDRDMDLGFNPHNAEIFLYKPWRPNLFL